MDELRISTRERRAPPHRPHVHACLGGQTYAAMKRFVAAGRYANYLGDDEAGGRRSIDIEAVLT